MNAVIPAPDDNVEQLLTLEEVARRLDVSQDTVTRMSRDGRFIKPMHIGALARWRVRDFNHWVEQRAAAIEAIEKAAGKSARKKRNG